MFSLKNIRINLGLFEYSLSRAVSPWSLGRDSQLQRANWTADALIFCSKTAAKIYKLLGQLAAILAHDLMVCSGFPSSMTMMIVVRLIGNSFPLQLTSSLTNHTPRAQNTRICSKGNFPRNVYVARRRLFFIFVYRMHLVFVSNSTRYGDCGLCFFCFLCVRTLFRTLLFLLPRSRFDTDTSLLCSSPQFVGWLLELDNHFSSTVVAPLAGRSKNYIFSLLFPRFGGYFSLRIIRLLATKTA